MSNASNDGLRIFETGAVRTKDADGERYDLITPIGLEGVARIYAEGAGKYGESSWEKGMPISDLVNHGLRHWRLYASGDRSEDHLSKCAWAFLAAKHSEVCWPHLNTNLRRQTRDQLCVPCTVDDATAASWAKFKESMEGLRKEYRESEGKPDGSEQAPATRTAPKYHFLADTFDRGRMALYRTDLEFEGHDVVTRWIDREFNAISDREDIQACDVVVVFAEKDGGRALIHTARDHGKQVVVIGEWPSDFPRREGERQFPIWDHFMRDMVSSRSLGSKIASTS